MNRTEKHLSIKRIGWLEELHCDQCENKLLIDNNAHTVCKDCPIYKELRTLGDFISPPDSKKNAEKRGRPLSNLCVKQYVQARMEGLSQKDIGKRFGVAPNTISSFVYNHKDKINAYADELGVTLPQRLKRGRKSNEQ